MTLSERNKMYISDRLFVPAPNAMEAIDRLREIGEDSKAERLTHALAEFKTICRAIAREL